MSLETCIRPINETDLCSKIQKLMCNIKSFYIDKDKYGSKLVQETNCNTCESNNDTNYDSDIMTISSLSIDNASYSSKKENDNSNNNTCENTSWKKSQINIIPQQTFQKVMTLEVLISSIEKSANNKVILTENHSICLKLSKLRLEFNDLILKIKMATECSISEKEMLSIMQRLRDLFGNLKILQQELTKYEDRPELTKAQSLYDLSKVPRIPPRNSLKLQKTKMNISNVNSSSEEMDIKYHNRTNNNLINKPILNSNDVYKAKDKKALENCSNHELIKLKKQLFAKRNCDPLNNSYYQIDKMHNNDNLGKPSVNNKKIFSKSSLEVNKTKINVPVNCEFESYCNQLNKQLEKSKDTKSDPCFRVSRLPVLKKDPVNNNNILDSSGSKISSISETITHQVLLNLKKCGVFIKDNNEISYPKNSKPKEDKPKKSVSTNSIKLKPDEDTTIKPNVYNSNGFYLTKTNLNNLTKQRRRTLSECNDNNRLGNICQLTSLNSQTKIFDLESLIERSKFQFITAFKENCPIKQKKKSKGLDEIQLSYMASLTSIIGNTIRISHQLILYPSEVMEIISEPPVNSLPAKHPRLIHIEHICQCHITMNTPAFTAKYLNRSLVKRTKFPLKFLLIDIHYDLRRGKALGCVNMLRDFAGSEHNKEMKILKTTLLLPGGYVTELPTCSINRLVNLTSVQALNTEFRMFQMNNNR